MDKIIERGILFDFYGALLTEHQQGMYSLLVTDDFSLGEIAEEYGISRQAVHDLIKRCDKILEDYEVRLGLVGKFKRICQSAEQIKEKTTEPEIMELAAGILKEL